jgi:hypothetical protein
MLQYEQVIIYQETYMKIKLSEILQALEFTNFENLANYLTCWRILIS